MVSTRLSSLYTSAVNFADVSIRPLFSKHDLILSSVPMAGISSMSISVRLPCLVNVPVGSISNGIVSERKICSSSITVTFAVYSPGKFAVVVLHLAIIGSVIVGLTLTSSLVKLKISLLPW
ncbi:MAG: hypothetical protein C00003105_00867 [ANME-2 cluster archaeon HR1]|nr:MAG: hypothetical protein C00003105_00867 [ANME-2 cluster archaeon HR1]